MSTGPSQAGRNDFDLERYKFILQQIHTTNENVQKFLGIFQGVATTLLTAGIGLFVGYRKWNLTPSIAETGIEAVMWLVTLTSAFTILMVLAGLFSWFDYRKEECLLLERCVGPGARDLPRLKNFWRWYETYIIMFIVAAAGFLWFYVHAVVLPSMA